MQISLQITQFGIFTYGDMVAYSDGHNSANLCSMSVIPVSINHNLCYAKIFHNFVHL